MTTQDTLDLLRTADPYAQAAPDPDRAVRMDAALERLLVAEPPRTTIPSGSRTAPRHRARTLGVVLTTAAACGAGLIAALPGDGGNAPGVQAASAATVLSNARAAVLEADQPGPWTAMTIRSWRNEPFKLADGKWGVALVSYTSEQWSSDGGEQLLRNTRGTDVQFPRASDKAAYDPAKERPTTPRGLPDLDGKLVRLDAQNSGNWTVADIHALPTDPDALAAALSKGVNADPGSKFKPDVVLQATALLLSPLPTAEQRAALYTVLLRTPGAQLIPKLTDPDGRTGEGVRFVKPNPPTTEAPGGYDQTLLFDPQTHTLLGLRQDGDETSTIGRKLTSWSLVLDAHRAETAPKPELEQRYPAGSEGSRPPEFLPVG
ncbi:MAG: CU044_5270 family protein [Baekduia sp.]